MLFQIAQALYTGQSILRLTHNDLHIDNIGYQNSNQPVYEYWFDGNPIYIYSPKFIIKILDYGFSRIETINNVINAKIDTIPVEFQGVFNPYYDFMCVLGSLTKILKAHLSLYGLNELISFVFGEPIVGAPSQFLSYINNKYYKPNSWRPIQTDIRGTSFRSIQEICDMLIQKLVVLNVASVSPPANYAILHSMRLPFSYSPQPNRALIQDNYTVNIDNCIRIGRETINFPVRSYNYGVIGLQKTVVINSAFIDTAAATTAGYTFNISCCKTDMFDYMENNYGVAINGAYIQKITREPIGDYRQSWGSFETNIPIPKVYERYYGAILVDTNGVEIVRLDERGRLTSESNLFVSGLLLIFNGQETFNEYNMELSDATSLKLFQCQRPSLVMQNIERIPIFSKQEATRNCYLLNPGELSGGNMLIRRSMLIIRNDSFNVVLATLDGADYIDLLQFAQSSGATYAISLSEGLASNLVYRDPNTPDFIYSSNNLGAYVVSNILALTK